MATKAILHLTGMTCTKFGGIENYLLHLGMHCKDLGFETILQYEAMPSSSAYLEALDSAGIKLMIQPINSGKFYGLPGIASLIAKIRPEIVHTHFVNGIGVLSIPIFARMFGARKSIAMVHNKSEDPRRFAKRVGYNLYDDVLCVSDAVRKSLLSGGVKDQTLKTHYLGLFENHEKVAQNRYEIRKNLGIPEEAILLSCIAFDAYFKGWDILIEALAEVTKKNKLVYLMSVGVNPKESKLPSLAQQLGVSEKIRWVGIVDDGYLLLNAADIYVQPSRNEGLPLSIMEAMTFRLPVVCTNIAGNVEAVENGESGIVVESDPKSLARGILLMLDKRPEWERMGRIGRERFLKLFDGNSSIKRLASAYYL